MDAKKIVGIVGMGLAAVYGTLDRLATAHTLPSDLQDFWRQHMSGLAPGNFILFAVSLAIALWAFWPQIKSLLGAHPATLDFGRVSMSKASALMFVRAKPETKKFVTGHGGNHGIDVYKRPENFFASVLIAHAQKREIEVWGRRAKSLSVEKLEPTDLALGRVIDGDSLMSSTAPSALPIWIDLQVKRSDALMALKKYEEDQARYNARS